MPIVGLRTMLSRLTVSVVSSRPMLPLGGWISPLEGMGLPVLFGISVAGGAALVGVVRFCSATSVVALSGRLMIFGITGPLGTAMGGAAAGVGAGGAFTAGAAGAV